MSKKSIFRRGYKALEEEKKRQESFQSGKSSIYRLYVKEGEANIVFLTEEPVNFYEHIVRNTRNGKEYFDNVTCLGDNCHLCDDGDRPSFKSAWLVLDLRPYEYEDKKTGKRKTIDKQLKLYVVGTKTAGVLQRKSQRYGLLNTEYILERIGKKTDTTYTLDKEGKYDVDESEINEMLPEAYQDVYDGTPESLMDIIESEIIKNAPKNVETSDDEEDDEDEAIIGVDDTEEEEEKPKKKTVGKKKFKFKK